MSDKILRMPQVINRTGLSRSLIYKYLQDGTFPKRVSLGPRAMGFSEKAINKWVDDRIKEAA